MEATPFSSWESFYVIVGSSAAALTGLQFVVITLGAEWRAIKEPEILAFSSPTVVHFCAALLVAAVLSAPWHALLAPRLILTVAGLAGIVYIAIVVRRARGLKSYQPTVEDWVWHCGLPLVAYVLLALTGFLSHHHPVATPFVLAGATLLLLFAGIHNTWDAVTYIAVQRRGGEGGK